MSKPSQGEWQVEAMEEPFGIVASIPVRVKGAKSWAVCYVPESHEAEANAALIAAAPDFLAALQSIALIANGGHGTPKENLAGIVNRARAAIAKAEGGAA